MAQAILQVMKITDQLKIIIYSPKGFSKLWRW